MHGSSVESVHFKSKWQVALNSAPLPPGSELLDLNLLLWAIEFPLEHVIRLTNSSARGNLKDVEMQ